MSKMLQRVEMTDQEQYKMYMKLTKAEIVMMLIESNRCLDKWIPCIYLSDGTTGMNCTYCGKSKCEHSA